MGKRGSDRRTAHDRSALAESSDDASPSVVPETSFRGADCPQGECAPRPDASRRRIEVGASRAFLCMESVLIGILSAGMPRIPHLEVFLDESWVRLRPWTRTRIDKVAGWGLKPTADRARRYAARRRLPYLSVEDGFLRSRGLGADEPPLSLVVDDLGIYYDANRPSRLEALVRESADAQSVAEGERLAAAWRAARVSKYNHQPDVAPKVEPGFALVVDQTFADASIVHGRADERSFARLLEAALDEDARREVLVKVHPDVLAGRKQGCIDLGLARGHPRVRVVAEPHHPPALLERAAAVYAATSQFGFEALIWGVPVRTFGMPFYAGWGLTEDDQPPPDRRTPVPLGALVQAALQRYPRYVDPETGERILAEEAMGMLQLRNTHA